MWPAKKTTSQSCKHNSNGRCGHKNYDKTKSLKNEYPTEFVGYIFAKTKLTRAIYQSQPKNKKMYEKIINRIKNFI